MSETNQSEYAGFVMCKKHDVMRAEVRQIRDICNECKAYLVLIVDDKSMPYMHIPETLPNDVLKTVLAKLNA